MSDAFCDLQPDHSPNRHSLSVASFGHLLHLGTVIGRIDMQMHFHQLGRLLVLLACRLLPRLEPVPVPRRYGSECLFAYLVSELLSSCIPTYGLHV